MSVEQHLQWISIPAGSTPGGAGLRLSVFVAPRLRTDEATTLAPFPDFGDWPARVRDATFTVELDDGTRIPATLASDQPDSQLWSALFSPSTPLEPFEFDDYADRPFVTYSAREVLSCLRQIYARVAATSPDELPRIVAGPNAEPRVPGLIEVFEDLRGVHHGRLLEGVDNGEALDARIAELLGWARSEAARRRSQAALRGGPLLEALEADGSVSRHFERALLFHRRPGEPVAMPADDDAAEHFKATVDFHQMVAALGDHPAVLRRLGLVVDLVVPAGDVPDAAAAAPLLLRVQPTWQSLLEAGQSSDALPWTSCVHVTVDDESFFAAAARHPDPMAPPDAPPTGLLPLPQTAFGVEQIDIDGAALKALNLAATLQAVDERPGPEKTPLGEPESAGVPALRTSGLALLQTGRAAALQSAFGEAVLQNQSLSNGADLTLYAEDIVRGYRLDVWEQRAGAWRSLHRRVASYRAERFPGELPAVTDEGFFQVSLAGAAAPPGQQPDANGELYVHETLVTWDGWSLAAARPGKSLGRDPRAPNDDPATHPQRVTNEPLTATGLAVETAVEPGSLPRLRFGHGYRLRVRTVDLAGGGPTVDEATRRLALSATDTPIVPATGLREYLRFEPVAAPALVPRARFTEGSSLLRLVIRSNAGVSAEGYAEAFNASELVTAGGHAGYQAFDDRHIAAPKASLQLVELHGLLDDVVGSDGEAPDEARRAAIRAAYDVARREEGSFDDASLPTAEVVELRSDVAEPQHYVVHGEEQLTLPYLPDPLATGAVLRGLPGLADLEPYVVTFDAPVWHDAEPFRLRLAEGSDAPAWDAEARLLTVALPQAATASVRVCSLFSGDLWQMGIVRWCEETLDGADMERFVRAAEENRCWMLTPWHDLELIHAVQQPLAQPQFWEFEAWRFHDSTAVELYAMIGLHAPSTEKVDLVAAWSEPVDDLALPAFEVRASESVVFDLALRVAAEGRTDVDPREVSSSLRDGEALTFCTAPHGRDRGPTSSGHAFGDTKHRRVAYRVMATTPFREYFPPEWASRPELLSSTSEVHQVDVPSSAPPAAPRVQYVVPTLGWEIAEANGSVVRRRRGGGLRVYLARPWFSSGDGEQLGVVVGYPLTSPSSDDYPYVTLLGQDPVRGGEPLEFPTTATLRNAAAVVEHMRLLETGERITVVAFDVAYDEETQRWLCDIDLDTAGAYCPFVRLALVRYQANSLSGCHLSTVVLSDIVQTLPDRTLRMTRDEDAAGLVRVTVTGPSYTAVRELGEPREDEAALGRVTARLEERDPSVVDDVLCWRTVGASEVELSRASDGATVTWSGTLELGEDGGLPRRVSVLEHDHLPGDAETTSATGLAARVVYADAVEL